MDSLFRGADLRDVLARQEQAMANEIGSLSEERILTRISHIGILHWNAGNWGRRNDVGRSGARPTLSTSGRRRGVAGAGRGRTRSRSGLV